MDLGGKPLVQWVVDRVRMAQQVDEVWVLTTTNPEDDRLTDVLEGKVNVLRGDALNVASRYESLFERTYATHVIRVTGDCPLVDGRLLDQLIQFHQEHHADYSHILAQPYYEPSYPNGFNGELFTAATFARMRQFDISAGKEHVTSAIDVHPEAFAIARLAPPLHLSRPHWKLSVDTDTELQLVRAIVAALGSSAEHATAADIIAVLDAHPDWHPSI